MNIPFSAEELASVYPSIAEQAARLSGLPNTEIYPIWNRVLTGLDRLDRYPRWWEPLGDEARFDVASQDKEPVAVISQKTGELPIRLTPEQRRLAGFSPINYSDRAEVAALNGCWNGLAAVFRSRAALAKA